MARSLLFWDSSEEITSAGNINSNSVIITEPVKIEHDLIVYAVCTIAAIKVAELLYLVYRTHQRRLKKKYQQSNGNHALA